MSSDTYLAGALSRACVKTGGMGGTCILCRPALCACVAYLMLVYSLPALWLSCNDSRQAGIKQHSTDSTCTQTPVVVVVTGFECPVNHTGSPQDSQTQAISKCNGFPFQNVLSITSLVCVSIWSCLPLWTAACLHSVSYTTPFFWHPHAGNPTIQTQDSLALDPTFGIHSHKTLDTAQPCHF